MPKTQIDYQRGIIYGMYYGYDLVYIGSTTNFNKRKSNHRNDFKCFPHKNPYKEMVILDITFENIRFEEIEKYPCNTKEELIRREGELIREHKPLWNKDIAGRTRAEWKEDNKEDQKNKKKEYYEKNKEKIIDRVKDYYLNNIEQKKEYYKSYSEVNKEKLLEQKKEYYKANKEKVRAKYNCICGVSICISSKGTHEKTKKHIEYLENSKNEKV